MNRAKIYEPCQVRVTRNGHEERTCPKLKDNPSSPDRSGVNWSWTSRANSIVHTQKPRGNNPMDRKNTNGNRRPMVFLLVWILQG
jgi:hypothetical protein